jgi:hypothetical protein
MKSKKHKNRTKGLKVRFREFITKEFHMISCYNRRETQRDNYRDLMKNSRTSEGRKMSLEHKFNL